MKPCPDCAESVQDAARKCRFCGYRFDQEAELEAPPATQVAPPTKECPDCAEQILAAAQKCRHCGYEFDAEHAPAETGAGGDADGAATVLANAAYSQPASWPFVLLALGGVAIAAGGLAMALVGMGHTDPFVGVLALGLPAGGIVLALAFGALLPSGRAEIGAVLGSLAIPGAALLAWMLFHGEPAATDFSGLILTLGMIGCAYGALATLAALDMQGTRLAAQVSLLGFGVQAIASLKSIDFPDAVQITLAVLGIGGMLLFGLGLAIGSLARLVRP